MGSEMCIRDRLDSVANMGTSWLLYSYDLSAYAGTEVRIAIVYRGEYGYGLNVDDVAAPEIVVEELSMTIQLY